MIKLNYEQKQYTYDFVGAQPYDVKVQMELKEDANISVLLHQFGKLTDMI